LRARRNALVPGDAILSQGVPMLLGGDENRPHAASNNNAYCQDNDISWFDWNLKRSTA